MIAATATPYATRDKVEHDYRVATVANVFVALAWQRLQALNDAVRAFLDWDGRDLVGHVWRELVTVSSAEQEGWLVRLTTGVPEERPALYCFPYANAGPEVCRTAGTGSGPGASDRSGPLPEGLIVAGRRAPHVSSRGHELPDSPPPGDAAPDTRSRADRVSAARTLARDLALCRSYRYRAEAPLPLPIVAVAGLSDEGVTYEDVAAWDEHTQQGVRVALVEGATTASTRPGRAGGPRRDQCDALATAWDVVSHGR